MMMSASCQSQTWRTRLPYLRPSATGWPAYAAGHRVARVPRDCHFLYPLTWAPEQIKISKVF